MKWNRKNIRPLLLRNGGFAGIVALLVLQANCCHGEKLDGIISAAQELTSILVEHSHEHDHGTAHHDHPDQKDHDHKGHEGCGEHDCPASGPDSALSEERRVSFERSPDGTPIGFMVSPVQNVNVAPEVSVRLAGTPPRGSPPTGPRLHLLNQTFLN